MQAFEQSQKSRPLGSRIQTRLAMGFVAGFISVWIFSNGVIALLYAAGAPVPLTPWSMTPVPPFGLPRSVSGAFWGGLWGVVYALLEPRLTARLGWWCGGLAFGAVLPLFTLWFVVMPLKGIPIGGGFTPTGVPVDILLHAVFGLGTAIVFRLVSGLVGRGTPLPPTALSERSRG
jgi:hypothetical protein